MADDAAPAADALFGDAGDDLFGAVDPAASALFDSDLQNPAHDTTADIAGVFGAPADGAADPFASVGAEPDVAGDVAGGSTGAGLGSALDDYASQGWYDDDGTFHLYEDPAESFARESKPV
jgi:hypothetical protein